MHHNLQVFIWDVGHGLSVSIFTPDVVMSPVELRRRWIQFDANNNTETNFSPIAHIYDRGFRTMDYLIISHPDQDHIGDLPALQYLRESDYDKLRLRILSRNRTLPSGAISENPENEVQAKTDYRKLDTEYIYPNILDIDQLTAVNFGGVVANSAYNDYSEEFEINDCSLLYSIEFDNLFLVLPGDMTSYGFTKLVEENKIATPSDSQNVILIAPHHGSETVEAEAFLQFYKPKIVLASAGNQDTNSDQIYSSNLVQGYPVVGEPNLRKYLTTKHNNAILIDITPGSPPVISLIPHD